MSGIVGSTVEGSFPEPVRQPGPAPSAAAAGTATCADRVRACGLWRQAQAHRMAAAHAWWYWSMRRHGDALTWVKRQPQARRDATDKSQEILSIVVGIVDQPDVWAGCSLTSTDATSIICLHWRAGAVRDAFAGQGWAPIRRPNSGYLHQPCSRLCPMSRSRDGSRNTSSRPSISISPMLRKRPSTRLTVSEARRR